MSNASAPEHNVVVLASAGTGKTWLLVTRIIRLLLDGARPDALTAITFTRKGAVEMQARLSARLFDLARCDETTLHAELVAMGLAPDEAMLARAQGLYEALLKSEHSLKITTFHAFCQELLRRFPLEAAVPPDFELIEQGGVLERSAMEALFGEATAAPEGDLAHALEVLFDHAGGLAGTRTALNEFLQHRSDWWAYTEAQQDPVQYASATLARQLQLDENGDACSDFFAPAASALLAEFAALLLKHTTATNRRDAGLIHAALSTHEKDQTHFHEITPVFLKADGAPRARPITATLTKALGDKSSERFITLHEQLCAQVMQAREREARRTTAALSTAWFVAGACLIAHYQRIKNEQRLLDFSDLEWKACQLLNHSDNAQWVQYKLDQRIDHLLVDEFQDTNPTQWHLLLPLLQELAAGPTERSRSVFLVGDLKQSIYSFRRANPELFSAARSWLEQHLNAMSYPLDTSWRSAPVICEFLNAVFYERLPSFQRHSTHRTTLWGRVELLPLIHHANGEDKPSSSGALRNPLQQPRSTDTDRRHTQEGVQVAQRIRALMEARTPIADGATARVVDYNDILILLRNRTHVHAYESALRAAGIPFIGADRGTLLDTLEVQDMIALLDVLMTPYDNLALAQVLRSPLFACSDADLMQLASGSNDIYWIDRLAALAPAFAADAPLRRAHHWLAAWRERAGHIPVHDLLDRIYAEGNVLARYEAAYPAPLRARVRANLTRFIELALEVDSGRYPSPTAFRARLRDLREAAQEAPDEAPAPATEPRVRILTIHAAKGLESPVVFVADATVVQSARRARALIHWPAQEARPSHFLLHTTAAAQDSLSRELQTTQEEFDQREEMNLLYVALTRAQQFLYISGCAPKKGNNLGWYGMIAERVAPEADPLHASWLQEADTLPAPLTLPPTAAAHAPPAFDARLARPITTGSSSTISPSRAGHSVADTEHEDAARTRGSAIHRLLERLTLESAPLRNDVLQPLADELLLDVTDPALQTWWDEAVRVVQHPSLRFLFDPAAFVAAYNEMSLLYEDEDRNVHGIIDRLVITPDTVWVIDYKTHPAAHAGNLAQLAEPYREQMRLYARGAARLWPGKRIRPVLLFTACAGLCEMEESCRLG
ncbi:MAG: UvrD-helicase domain-containing protein [Gammaproteobacteria bacterium]|nr:UvrD-helicase domain-containing protein [Gammaproteobacteria bacterium]